MRRQPPPFRFLTLVVGLWACSRALMIAPDRWIAPAPAEAVSRTEKQEPAPIAPLLFAETATVPPTSRFADFEGAGAPPVAAPLPAPSALMPRFAAVVRADLAPPSPLIPIGVTASVPQPVSVLPPIASPGRWSGSAWLLLRDETGPALAPGGTLGGSQSGVRIAWRLNGDAVRPLAVSARFHAPVSRRSGAEAAIGLDWRPLGRVPVHILAERRQAIGREGRSAFALALHGGVSELPLPGGVRLDAYGQAGIVGARSRDPFADGAARLSLPLTGRVSAGAGVWGGAQPGAARLDAGPHVALRLPVAGGSLRLSAEYRFRIAGDASPGSGPAFTLGSDF